MSDQPVSDQPVSGGRIPSGGPLPHDGTVAVVGASLAGLRAAEALRREGFGGRVVLIGEEMHLPYDRPPLSKQVLAGTWVPERAVLADRNKLDELRIEHRPGHRAVALDIEARRVTLDDGDVLEADGVVVATGARPRQLRGTEGNPGVHVLRTLDDAVRLRQALLDSGEGGRLVVVGAGFIGSEVASTGTGLGAKVTVVEALQVPLSPILGREVGAACAGLHTDAGVELRTDVGVMAVRPPAADDGPAAGRAGVVELSDGSAVPADVVVVGIGVVPAVDWLEDSGLPLGNGVHCDKTLFAAEGIVAAGDLAHWEHVGLGQELRIEHWQVAAEQGVAAARNLLAGWAAAEPFSPVPYFWSDQYGVRIQVLGHPGPEDEVALAHGSYESRRFVALFGRAGRLTGVLGISQPRRVMAFRALLVAGASWDEALAVDLG